MEPMSLFPLTEVYSKTMTMVREIGDAMEGRIATSPEDCAVLGEAIVAAGRGSHVEIGALFGGTAILAALLKREYDLQGMVYAIDPFTGYYGANRRDLRAGMVPTVDIAMRNAEKFGVLEDILWVPARSDPWPEMPRTNFVSAFIDGWHWGGTPLADLQNTMQRVEKFVVVDNYDRGHRTVVMACRQALAERSDWVPTTIRNCSLVLERSPHIIDSTHWGEQPHV